MSAHEAGNGTLRLVDQRGESVYLQPDDTLKISTTDGEVTEARARDLCRSTQGLSLRGDDSCAQSRWIASWEEISVIEVEQFDGASSVAISTAAAILVVGALVVLVSSGEKGKTTGSSKPGKTDHLLAAPSAGKPSAPATNTNPAPPRQRPPRHTHTHGSSVNVFWISGSSSSSGSYGEDGPPPVPALGEEDRPLFSDSARRRAVVLPFLRGELGGCLGSESCASGSVRGGVILKDFVELSGGMRWDRLDKNSSRMLVLGAGLQGKFPSFPSLALALGSLFALGDSTRIAPYAGLRGHLGAGFWAGLQPLGVTFFLPEKRVAYTPSVDLAFSFLGWIFHTDGDHALQLRA